MQHLSQPSVSVYYDLQDANRAVRTCSVPDAKLISGLLVLGCAVFVGLMLYLMRYLFAKKYGETPSWTEIFPWLRFMPIGRQQR